ncbi:hypothetical protein KVR01_003956 [Diaporthe batatas]|uniref:uncharacterized protein n=1 Tax=Diaporthe batatas TaxID=748121 RepID=UPI001D05958C|nr:uncharacterized protein KVR01_003956 [Diaporthe batatas]KAG8168267.1 hypothetical protein KVR01_003956 [Diaporthe batatas]
MVKASCVCGDSAYDFTGKYQAFIACHCIPCRKVTGADRSLNLVVHKDEVTVTSGTDRLVSRRADSGKDLTYHQCKNCGNTMFAISANAPEMYFLKAGLIDDNDFLNALGPPKTEIYCKYLLDWEKTFDGAQVTQN